MSLELTAVVEERGVEIELTLSPGEHVAILGPNGAGKSTVLGVLSGLLRPDRGRATLEGETLFDLDGASAVWRPPHARAIATLAQDALLFPHMSALENVAFGPRNARRSRAEAHERARAWLEEVDALQFERRKPAQLSGGQAQRIAVARALAAEPRLLLLDEPMAALDVTVVPSLRQMLRRVLADRTVVLVTHDLLDALMLADRVVVMEDGRIVEDGPSRGVLARPRSEFGARIAGLNFIRGTVQDGAVRGADGVLVQGVSNQPLSPGGEAVAVFDPASVAVHREPPGGSPRNVFSATIVELEPRGSQVRVRTEEISADLTAAAVADLDLVPGGGVYLVIKASAVDLYPA